MDWEFCFFLPFLRAWLVLIKGKTNRIPESFGRHAPSTNRRRVHLRKNQPSQSRACVRQAIRMNSLEFL